MENNKFNLNLGMALECGDKYVDSLIDTMNMMKEQIENPERLEMQLNEIRRDTNSFMLMTTEFHRLIKEKAYQAAFNQYMINTLYEKFRDEVLPGDDMSVLTDYLNELDENELLENITVTIQDYITTEEYDEYELLGYRSEYKHADDGESDYVNEEIVLSLKRKSSGDYYEIRCYEDGHDLGYDYNTWGYAYMEKVDKIFVTSKIKTPLNVMMSKEINNVNISKMKVNDCPIDLTNTTDDYYFEIKGIIEVDYDGNDDFYPRGYMKFNKDKFEEPGVRQMTKRPVWIFRGDSGLGKSYITSIVERMGYLSVFETDSIKGDELQDKIIADIIVIGNKHGFKTEYVKSFVPNPDEVEFIEVNFSK